MSKVLLDTDIFSEILKGRNQIVRERADAYLAKNARLTISCITVMEVVKGFHKAGRQTDLERFLRYVEAVEVLSLDQEAAVVAGRIYADLEKRGQPIGRADPMVAALALVQGLVLVTGNEQHYARINDAGHPLVVDNWRNSV